MKNWPLGVSFFLVIAGFPLLSWGNWSNVPVMWITGLALLVMAALVPAVSYRMTRAAE